MTADNTRCPFTPPYPTPQTTKPGLLKRFRIGWNSWIHTLGPTAYGMKMGGTKLPGGGVYVVNEAPVIRRVLDEEVAEFPKHAIFDDLLKPLVGSSVFNANGAEWERQRAMVNPAFMHTGLKRAFPVMAAAMADMIARMSASAAQAQGRPVDVDPMMTHAAADVIFRTMFSRPLTEAEALRVYHQFEAYQALAQRNTLLTLYGLPHFGLRRRARRIGAEIRASFADLIDRRMAERAARAAAQAEETGAGEHDDILETLLDMRHPTTGAAFEHQDLINQVTLIFFGGHETTATSLGWTLYLLSECPDLQEKLYAEIEAVTGGGPLAYEHLRSLEGVRNLYRESLRLYPPVSFLPRSSTRRIEARGKVVNPGDLLVVAPWLVHRNPDNWACPHEFDPDRFVGKQGADAAKAAWIPFGRGPRVCIGAGFAQQEAALALTEIIRHFRIAHPDGPRPQPMARLTLRPKAGFPLILTPR